MCPKSFLFVKLVLAWNFHTQHWENVAFCMNPKTGEGKTITKDFKEVQLSFIRLDDNHQFWEISKIKDEK